MSGKLKPVFCVEQNNGGFHYAASAAFENSAYVESGCEPEPKTKKNVAVDECARADPFDPHDFGKTENATSFSGTVLHLVVLIASPGLLSVPSAFFGAGYVTGFVVTPLLFCLYVHNARMIVWSEYQICKMKRLPTLSYPQMAYHAFNDGPKCGRWFAKWSRKLSYVDFLLVWFSYYCYNYLLMCQNLQTLVRNVWHEKIPINTLLQICVVPQLLLVGLPKFKYLAPFSMFGNFFNFVSLALIVYFVIRDPFPWQIPPQFGNLSSVSLLVGSVLINLNLAGIFIPLKNEMKSPHRFASRFGVLVLSYLPTSLVYTLFSLSCVLKYGASVKPSVTENLPAADGAAQAAIFMSSLAIICLLPLIAHVPYDIIRNQLLANKFGSPYSGFLEYFLRAALVLLSVSVCTVVPNVFLFVSLSGTVGTSVDSFMLPALINTIVAGKVYKNRRAKFWLIFAKNMVIIAVAVVLVISGCTDCVNQIVRHYSLHRVQSIV